jgi:hypothetical protein
MILSSKFNISSDLLCFQTLDTLNDTVKGILENIDSVLAEGFLVKLSRRQRHYLSQKRI